MTRSLPLPLCRPIMFVILAAQTGCPGLPRPEPAEEDRPPEVDCTAERWTTDWERVGDDLVLEPTDREHDGVSEPFGSWEWTGEGLSPLSVVPFEDGRRLYYWSPLFESYDCSGGLEAPPDGVCWSRKGRVGLAESEDGLSWSRVGDPFVIDFTDEGGRVGVGSVHRDPESGIWTYYAGATGGGITTLSSADGIAWARSPDPAFLADAHDPVVLPSGPAERLWYMSVYPEHQDQDELTSVNLAVREAGGWARWPDNPVVHQGRGDDPVLRVHAPSVVDVEGCLVMAVRGVFETGGEIVLAVSRDGSSWTSFSEGRTLSPGPGEDGLGTAALWVDGDEVWMAFGVRTSEEPTLTGVALARRSIPRPGD